MPNKYAVYTVIAGGYDNVLQPEVIDDRFDYILFSDTITSDVGVWSVRPITYVTDKLWLKARFPRLNPEIVLPEYDAWLYFDGNIQITSQFVYDRCVELANKGVEWAGIKHQDRDSLFDELNAIIGLGWVHDYEVLDWYRFLLREKYPNDNGMFETGIIFRLHTENVQKINEKWWWSLESFGIRRDQFSLMWAMWKSPSAKKAYFLSEDENAWKNSGAFVCGAHKPHKRMVEKSLWEKLRDRYVRMFYWDGGWEVYYTHWFDKLLKHPFPHLAMHLWTAWVLVRYDLKFLAGRAWQRVIRKRKQ